MKNLHGFRGTELSEGSVDESDLACLTLQGNELGETFEVSIVLARRVLLVHPRRGGPPTNPVTLPDKSLG
jgi:hypothetical protein